MTIQRLRGFEIVSKYADAGLTKPARKTKLAAGYDIAAAEDVLIQPYSALTAAIFGRIRDEKQKVIKECEAMFDAGSKDEAAIAYSKAMTMHLDEIKAVCKKYKLKTTLIPTGIKAYMQDDEVLKLFIRSSTPLNNWIIMANGTGIIDADYYNNVDNEGNIFFQVINLSPVPLVIQKGEFIGQGIFEKFLVTDDDENQFKELRKGGHGSTAK